MGWHWHERYLEPRRSRHRGARRGPQPVKPLGGAARRSAPGPPASRAGPQDREDLLAHIEAIAEQFQPTSLLEWLEVVRIGQHNKTIVDYHAYQDLLHQDLRRVADRQRLKQGWSQPTPGEREAALVAKEIDLRAVAKEAVQRVDTDAGVLDLDLDKWEYEADIIAAANALRAKLGLGPFGRDAEAFRLGLAERERIQRAIASEELRRAKLIDDFYQHRSMRERMTSAQRAGQ